MLKGLAATALTVVLTSAGTTSGIAASASWRCQFGRWNEPVILIAELGTGKGKFVGNQGTSDVWITEGPAAISFLEPLYSGAVQVTTIVLRTGEAAHSRNTILSPDGLPVAGKSTFLPTQVRGTCQAWN